MLVAQLCLILSDPVDCSPPGSSAHGIRQVRILQWEATPFFRRSSHPGFNLALLHCRQILYHLSHHTQTNIHLHCSKKHLIASHSFKREQKGEMTVSGRKRDGLTFPIQERNILKPALMITFGVKHERGVKNEKEVKRKQTS